tara:strand:+ start:202 stop:456 length:255 start_codon:yes stop_codon:yes gene_type:complete
MTRIKTEWLVIRTNKDMAVYTQVVEASELNDALNLAEENFDWERQAYFYENSWDNYYELLTEFGLGDIDLLPDDIQAFEKMEDE